MENYQTGSETTKTNGNVSKAIGAILILVAVYFLGFNTGKKGYEFHPKEFKIVNQNKQPQVVDYSLLWEALDVLNQKYIDKPVNPQKLLYGSIRGAMAATGDPYTDFFEPKDLESFKTDLSGSFFGIGAEIGKKNGVITIIAPLDGTPAKKAGLLPKDVIVEVDGQLTTDWPVEQAMNAIRGQRGTEVKLLIYRESKGAPFEVKIIRDKIEVKSVKWEIKAVSGQQIAVITVSRFGDDTKDLFDRAVNEALIKGARGIVLDLRNNGGGYLQTAVDLAGAWLPKADLVVKEQRGDGESTDYNSRGSARLASLRTVALINGGSASASEILAGALQDYGIAKLIGEKSFGKGSVQELIDLKDGSAIKVTIAKWITPNGKNLNKDGLKPDIEVKLTEEDSKNLKDPQMEKAIEELTKVK